MEIQPVKIRVSAVPESYADARLFAVYVEYRGKNDLGEWVVATGYQPAELYGEDGEWSYMPGMPDREMTDEEWSEHRKINDDWVAAHRFTYERALELAQEAALKQRLGPWSAEEYMAREDARVGR